MGTSKWRSIYFRQDVHKVYYSECSSKESSTFQLLQLSDAMRPEDDSCIDKVKKCTPFQNSIT